ncbi:hypothetical protein GEMRC1_012829 [Eukaryota sp. GEM-RC1]
MQGVGNVTDGVLILGATNIPWNLDSAVRRRFEKRIYIPLPEVHARAAMFKIHIGKTPHTLIDDDFQELGALTDGFSGSDVNVLVRDALYEPVRALQSSEFFKMYGDVYIPCSSTDNGAMKMSLMDIDPSKVGVPPLTRKHFNDCLNRVKPSVSEQDIEMHIEFTNNFGLQD